MDKTIVILGGGASTEREVSLRSADAIQRALKTAGYHTLMLDPAKQLAELDTMDPSKCYILPILHGLGGEDGTIQRTLDKKGYSYLGSNAKSSALAFDKHLTRQVLVEHNLPIAAGEKVTAKSYKNSALYNQPHVLKSCHGGSSIGTYICKNPMNIDKEAVQSVFEISDSAVIEELVEGIEVTVAILGDRALPVIEIIPPANGDFDYLNKYNGMTQEICPPEHVSLEKQAELQELAVQVHRVLGCRHLSRVDMIIKPDGKPIILEINTIPGMTDQSLYPKAALQAGITFPDLVDRFVHMLVK